MNHAAPAIRGRSLSCERGSGGLWVQRGNMEVGFLGDRSWVAVKEMVETWCDDVVWKF